MKRVLCLIMSIILLVSTNIIDYFGMSVKAQESGEVSRYTVIVLDTSSSTVFDFGKNGEYVVDTAIEDVKKAAKKFIQDIQNANGNNYVAIVSYNGDSAYIISEFSTDSEELIKGIEEIEPYAYRRSVDKGLQKAYELMNEITEDDAIKNTILFTTGMTNTGNFYYTGHYDKTTIGSSWYMAGTGIHLYAYANAAYRTAETLKENCTLYTVGLFGKMEDIPKEGKDIVDFFKLCTLEWASSSDKYFEVNDPNDLEFVFGEVAGDITNSSGIFYYPGKGKDYSADYYYDDNYFEQSSYVYNEHLATMSLCLELSAWGSETVGEDYSLKMKNAETLLADIGFEGFDHNYTDYENNGIVGKPTKDSIGAVAAHKKIKVNDEEYTLVAVAVRGGGYESEWASNFTVGASGQHQGFSEARNQVIQFLQDYIVEQEISGELKLWITGYSRAGATANMVAGAIDEGKVAFSNCNLELDNLYAYTFEPPMGNIGTDGRTDKFANIFNIVNPQDVVTKVAPAKWEFSRYGEDKFLPTQSTDDNYEEKAVNMLLQYGLLEGYSGYGIDYFSTKQVVISKYPNTLNKFEVKVDIVDEYNNNELQAEFLDRFISNLAREVLKSPAYYTENYQEAVREACGLIFGMNSNQSEKVKKLFGEKIKNNLDRLTATVYVCMLLEQNPTENICNIIAGWLRESLNEADVASYNEEYFNKSVVALVELLIGMITTDIDSIATLVCNLESIGLGHQPELCLAWLRSMDSNYTYKYGDDLEFSSGKYRIIRINCPVDVEVYNADGTLVASIIDDVPQEISSIISSVNSDGEKLVYLPASAEYQINLIATADGTVSYSVNEFNPYAGDINRIINYYDIPIVEGQTLTAVIAEYSSDDLENQTAEFSSTEYEVFANGEQLDPSIELTGQSAIEAYYDVKVIAEEKESGIVLGGGIRQLGAYAQVTAQPCEGYVFGGWYKDGTTLVSEEEEYRFCVVEDTELVAKFVPIKTEQDIDVVFDITSQWEGAFNANVTVTNVSDKVIDNWAIAFDMPYIIQNIWNATNVSKAEGKYVIKNAGYNQDIKPGESVTFGFTASVTDESVQAPIEYTLVGEKVQTVSENCEISFNATSDWETACNGQIVITNISDFIIEDWFLEFDFGYDITAFSEADIISHEGNHYVIKNKGYNANIAPGQSIILDCSIIPGSLVEEPINYCVSYIQIE